LGSGKCASVTAWGVRGWMAGLRVTAIVLLGANGVVAQNIMVDASPSHVVNTFSPPHALGGAIDRLRAGEGAPGEEETRITKEEVDKNTDTLLPTRCRIGDSVGEMGTGGRG
jgi:hypothetical protein